MTITLQIILVMFLWSTCFPLIILGLSEAPHLAFATLRAVLAGVALLALAGILRRPMPNGWRNWLALAVIGLGATTFGFLGMFHAAEFVSPGFATVVANTQPLMAALLAHVFLNENLDSRGKLGLFLGFLGIVLITLPQLSSGSGGNYPLGVAYIILAALGITVSNVLIKRIGDAIDPLMAMGWQLLLGSVPLALMSFATEQPAAITWSRGFLISLFSLSLLGTALVYWLWCLVLQRTELNKANAYSFLIPIFGLAMGVSFYGERIGWMALLGAGMALMGITMVNRKSVATANV